MNVKKTERDGIVRAYPENGKPLAWSASSGVELIERDGLYFKDLEKTGELLPYEDWRLPVEERFPPNNRGDCGPYALFAAPSGAAHGVRPVRRYI